MRSCREAVETADSPVRHTLRLTTADREVTIPVFLFQFPGVNVGSVDGGSGVNIQPTGFLAKIKTTKKDARFGTFRISGGKV